MWYLGWMKALCFFDWRVDSLFRVQQVARRHSFNGIPHPESKVPEFEFLSGQNSTTQSGTWDG